jgi:hypothetical protein
MRAKSSAAKQPYGSLVLQGAHGRSSYSDADQPDSLITEMRRTLIKPLPQTPRPYRSDVQSPEKLTAPLRV